MLNFMAKILEGILGAKHLHNTNPSGGAIMTFLCWVSPGITDGLVVNSSLGQSVLVQNL